MTGEILKTDASSGPPASLSPPRPHPPVRRSWWRGCRASSRGHIAYGPHRAARWAGPRGGPGRGRRPAEFGAASRVRPVPPDRQRPPRRVRALPGAAAAAGTAPGGGCRGRYQHVSRRGAGTGKGMRAQGPRWGGGRPSQLAELPAPRLGSKDVHAGGRVRPAWKQPSGPPWIGSAWLTCSGARPGVDRGTQGLPQPPPLHPDWGA